MNKSIADIAFEEAEKILDVGGDPDFTAKYKDGYEQGFIAGVKWADERLCQEPCTFCPDCNSKPPELMAFGMVSTSRLEALEVIAEQAKLATCSMAFDQWWDRTERLRSALARLEELDLYK